MIRVDISNEQALLDVDEGRLRDAVEQIVANSQWREASISVAIVDDATIRPINAQYLDHDYSTDVLSFVLEQSGEKLEGEVIVSAETALHTAARFGWQPADELLLYVIHGTLHLVGYDDLQPALQAQMRSRERECLKHFGLTPRYDD